jgi:hypothetical protein
LEYMLLVLYFVVWPISEPFLHSASCYTDRAYPFQAAAHTKT